MTTPDGYIREISSLSKEIRRINAQLLRLRAQKRQAESHLLQYMMSRNMEEYSGITQESLRPRRRKKAAERKRDGIDYFTQLGVGDPEYAWKELQSRLKTNPDEEDAYGS